MFDPLLIGLTTAYPGFLPALFVHVVDSILCLEGARHRDREECARVVGAGGGMRRRRRRRRSAGDVDAEGGGGGGGEVTAPELDDGVGDLGDEDGTLDLVRLEHHLQYLSRWVRYVLSRAFHMHFDKSVASWSTPENENLDVEMVVVEEQQERPTRLSKPTSNDGAKSPLHQRQLQPQRRQPIDLKKRGKKKWTAAQHLYMQGPLDYTYLHETVGLPLNSVCDRLLMFKQQRGDVPSATTMCHDEVSTINGCGTLLASSSFSNIAKTATTATTSVVGQLHQYLEDVVGKEDRVIFMGICDDNADRHEIRKEWERSSDANQMLANVGDDGRTNEITSEKMEEEVSKDREEESAPPQAKRQKKLSLEEMESIFDDDAHTMMHVDSVAPHFSTHALTGGNADNSTDESINDESLFHIKPWTLCKDWDACAIGTMPGYPS